MVTSPDALRLQTMLDGCRRETGRLLDEIEEKDEQIRQLKQAFAAPVEYPSDWKLTAQQSLILSALVKHAPRTVTYNALRMLIWEDGGSECAEDHIKVLIHAIRKKLKPLGVKVLNYHGVGYALSKEHAVLIRASEIRDSVAPADSSALPA